MRPSRLDGFLLFVFGLLLLAPVGCADQPTGVTAPAERYLPTLSLSIGQQVDIVPDRRAQYHSQPAMSSSAVRFLGMSRVTIYNPGGPAGEVQVYHFVARAGGQTVVTLRYTDGRPAVGDTINVRAVAPHGPFAQINSGFFLNTCAVTTSDTAYCWGGRGTSVRDTSGDVATPFYNTPVPLTGELTFTAISRGFSHTCGVSTDGAGYCWGDNFNGQLGDGGTTASSVPVKVTGGLTFSAVSAGVYHACGLTAAGAIYCWGNNYDGQLGNGTTSYVNSSPIRVSGDSSFVAVGAGDQYTCGLTAIGAAYCWGRNAYGRLGTGDTTSSMVPVPVSGGLRFTALSAGYFHVCGLTHEGAAYCWGGNFTGELGNGTSEASTTPVAVAGGLTFETISAGQWATCGVTTGGTAYCWGFNGYGQLGNATVPLTLAANATPVPVSGGLTFATISTGYLHTCGVTTQGEAYCWGDNSEGELGDGSTTIRLTPVLVFGP